LRRRTALLDVLPTAAGASCRRDLAETQDIADFEPQEFYADRDKVFVLGRYAWTMRNSGRRGDTQWLHVFTFRNGKLAAFRSLNDTALLAEAHRG
jgi:ketosteroid isomerase-like protein